MPSAHLVSVVIPAYNHEKYIQECVKSIIKQTYNNLELIVIDDGSRDKTDARITALDQLCMERFIDYLHIRKANEGVARTLNLGINKAKGKYVFLISSDDFVESQAIFTLVQCMEKMDDSYVLACGNADFVNEEGEKIYLDRRGKSHSKYHSSYYEYFIDFHTRGRREFEYQGSKFGSYPSLLAGNYIPIGLLLRREALFQVGLYDEHLGIEDLNMWLKLSKKYQMKYVDEILAHYRLHETNYAKLYKKSLIASTIQTLLKERKYSFSNGYQDVWSSSFADLLIEDLINCNFANFIFNVNKLNISYIVKYLVGNISKLYHIDRSKSMESRSNRRSTN